MPTVIPNLIAIVVKQSRKLLKDDYLFYNALSTRSLNSNILNLIQTEKDCLLPPSVVQKTEVHWGGKLYPGE